MTGTINSMRVAGINAGILQGAKSFIKAQPLFIADLSS